MLAQGTRLGPYEIVAPLGAGAMGEVYRARDDRLDRSVAIKILPGAFADDPDRLRRFTQEARAAGQLQHPNILAVFDFGTQEGTPYEVTELLEGETLRDRLRGGAVRPRQATQIAVQIAHGLAAAHEHGIAHRDLKPENLFLTHDGRVKILDFGLAKLTRQDPERSPTDSLAGTITAAGVILGTAGYIAPEQVRGEATDHRADLFALGAILYEMLTGKRAFHGDSPVDTLHAILHSEPPDFAEAGVSVPPVLERIVRRCLEKRPEQRYQSARDLAFHLEAAQEPSTQTSSFAAMRGARRLRWAWIAGAAATVLAVTGAAIVAPRLVGGPAGRLVRLQILGPPGTNLSDLEPPAMSPDGAAVAFVAFDSSGIAAIWVRRLSEVSARRVGGTDNGTMPFWSPDGQFLGFFADAQLKKVPLAGGAAEVICRDAHGRGGTWNRKGEIVFARGAQGPLYVVDAKGGEPRPVTALDSTRGEKAHRFPQFLPDGKRFVFMILASSDDHGIGVGDLRGKTIRAEATSRTGVIIAGDQLVYSRGREFLIQRFDPRRARVLGKPTSIGEAPDPSTYSTAPRISASGLGELVYVTPRPALSRLYWTRSDAETKTPIDLPADRYVSIAISPEGERIAMVRRDHDGRDDVWVADLTRGVTSRLTRDGRAGGSVLWSPDGQYVAFEQLRGSTFDLVMAPAGGGEPQVLYDSPVTFNHLTDWSRDGRWIVFETVEEQTNYDLWTIDRAGGGRASVYRRTSSNEQGAVISPDGAWVAYTSDESGKPEIYVESFPRPGQRIQVSNRGGFAPQWIDAGRRITYAGTDFQTFYAAEFSAQPRLRAGPPHAVRTIEKTVTTVSANDPSGRFIYGLPLEQGDPPSLTVVLNWRQLLRNPRP